MRTLLPWLVDLLCGLLFVGIAFFGARVLLQDPKLVYLFFPLLCTAALLFGFWRRRLGAALLAGVPLFVVAVQFFSGRNRPFMVLPIVVVLFAAAGALVRKRALVALLVIANVAAVFAGPAFVALIVGSTSVREAPIAYTLHLVDGRTITSEQLRGRVVVLDFWATWCVPCRYELPVIQRAYEQRKDVAAFFAVDGVMTDSPNEPGDTAARAAEFFRRGGYTIPLAWDGGAVLEKAFALRGFPALLVLDKDGAVRLRHTGYVGGEDLERTLLREIDALR